MKKVYEIPKIDITVFDADTAVMLTTSGTLQHDFKKVDYSIVKN